MFTLVIDEVTKKIQYEVLWCMLFADDIVLIDDIGDGVNQKLELWRSTSYFGGQAEVRLNICTANLVNMKSKVKVSQIGFGCLNAIPREWDNR